MTRRVSTPAPWLLAFCGLAALSGAEAPETAKPADPVRIGDPSLARLVRRSLRGAARRLEREECRRLLREFVDADGRALEETALDRGRDAPGYLQHMLYYDGEASLACRRPDVFAATAAPGSRVVQVCRLFGRVALNNPTLAEASLIHEMLHSLGLGESPPDPRAITARVLERCQ